jgi:hypothetical protein
MRGNALHTFILANPAEPPERSDKPIYDSDGPSRSKCRCLNKLVLAVIVVLIVIGATVAGFLEIGALSTPTKTITCPPNCGSTVSNDGGSEPVTQTTSKSTTTVNGTTYYADNVTSLMVAEGMGTFHFNNGSVTFLGVEFQTICTEYGSACPGVPAPPPGTTITLQSGPGITLNVTFPDHSSETISRAFPIGGFEAFSCHNDPQAGILIMYTNSSPFYKSYLLVSTADTGTTNSCASSGGGVSSNAIVATVTVTTTLTTQASQATTTYAIPTTSCTYMPVITTTTTTITVGPTPPASTSTTTVTTTSTSYSQTITVTSCTFSALPWVTSTVTTTATP